MRKQINASNYAKCSFRTFKSKALRCQFNLIYLMVGQIVRLAYGLNNNRFSLFSLSLSLFYYYYYFNLFGAAVADADIFVAVVSDYVGAAIGFYGLFNLL